MKTGVQHDPGHRAHICLLPGEDHTKATFLSPGPVEANGTVRLHFNCFSSEMGGWWGGTYSLEAENVL